MSERGSIATNWPDAADPTAVYLATRDAAQLTDASATRVLHLLSLTTPPVAGLVLRDVTFAGDGADLRTLSPGIVSSRILVTHGAELVLDVGHLAHDGSCIVTPLIFDGAGLTVVGQLEPKTAAAGMRDGPMHGFYRSPRLRWDVTGCTVLGVHLSDISAGNGVLVAGGAAAFAMLDTPVALMSWEPLASENAGNEEPEWANY